MEKIILKDVWLSRKGDIGLVIDRLFIVKKYQIIRREFIYMPTFLYFCRVLMKSLKLTDMSNLEKYTDLQADFYHYMIKFGGIKISKEKIK